MKKNTLALKSLVFFLVLFLLVGATGVIQASATGLVQTSGSKSTIVSPPPFGANRTSGSYSWYDGSIKYSTILNCGGGYTETGAGTYVGYWADPSDGQPTPNTVYYVHVVVYGIGNACSGQYAYIDIGLPANTSLAISTTNPVHCYGYGGTITKECPQSLPLSSYNTGMYNIVDAYSPYVWPLPQGYFIEFQIPVISTTTLSGSNFEAAVNVLDGNSSPWLYPTEGIYVFAPANPVPSAFNKYAPTNATTNQLMSTTLRWYASTNAARYDYCYDTSNDNACSNWASNGTSTSKTLTGLAANTTYYWHVRAVNSSGTTYSNGSTTAFWSFKTGTKPAAFTKTSPVNGATNRPAAFTLKWGTSTGATSYQYCIGKTNPCTAWMSNSTAISKALSGLTANTTYYWNIRALNSFGYTYANSSTTDWHFKTANKPTAFTKNTPANGVTNQPTALTLKWGTSTGATSYQYCISKTNPCTTWISTGTAISKALSGLTAKTTYYWNVKAINSFGSIYANGSTTDWHFKTK
jgi:hypothetical protein